MTEKKFNRTLITTALPYTNGPVHIGHLAGVYVPADIYARYLRLQGRDVLLIGGSDEHGVPITIKARKEGVTPQDIVDRYHALIRDSFAGLGISFDVYGRTTSDTHRRVASDFFRKLYDKGEFIEKTTEQLYDPEAGQFLADRYVTGTCPHCGNEHAYGDQCEACGTSLNATDLINPRSALSGAKPELRSTSHWYLPLDKWEPKLRHWILDQHKEWRTNVYGQCKSWLDMGLQPRAVSRDLNWGIPVPVEGAEGKVLYVWFDAPIGYISNTIDIRPDDWEMWWKQPDTRMIHFIGKDNIVFHCLIFPAMLMADGSYNLPDNVPANEFLNLENDKISTSRNWAVWLNEYLEDFPGKQDTLRYVLTANAPESKDNNFTWRDFQERNNSELVAILGNFVNRVLVLIQKYYSGTVPAPGILTEADTEALENMKREADALTDCLENFKFRDGLRHAMNMARTGNKYLADAEPWKVIKSDPERVKTILYTALQICANLEIAFAPFLPFMADRLSGMLGFTDYSWQQLGRSDLIAPETVLPKPEILFDKIEDDAIQAQLDKLAATKKANELSGWQPEAQKEEVEFELFQKLDLRVGKVLECKKVPKADKLLEFRIDDGMGGRTIVSGIAKYYKPEDLIGRNVCFVANFAPRKLRGVESRGMILSVSAPDGTLTLVEPPANARPGSSIG